jgi:hypothetical protein
VTSDRISVPVSGCATDVDGPELGKAGVDRIQTELLRVEGSRPVEQLSPPGVVRSLQRRQEIGVAPGSTAGFGRTRTLAAEASG